jgi:hypothetical protein
LIGELKDKDKQFYFICPAYEAEKNKEGKYVIMKVKDSQKGRYREVCNYQKDEEIRRGKFNVEKALRNILQAGSPAANAAPTNGTRVNGATVNGTPANGTRANGTLVIGSTVNGTSVNGSTVNGTPVNHVALDGGAVYWR